MSTGFGGLDHGVLVAIDGLWVVGVAKAYYHLRGGDGARSEVSPPSPSPFVPLRLKKLFHC
jgi:hypothetical protein